MRAHANPDIDNVIDLADQAMFLGEKATGATGLLQCAWVFHRTIDLDGLLTFHGHLQQGRLRRSIERSPLPFGRHRWVSPRRWSGLAGRGAVTVDQCGDRVECLPAANSCSGRPVVPYRKPTLTSPVVASAARYRCAVAREMPMSPATSAADIGASDPCNACNTSFLVGEATVVGDWAGVTLGRNASSAESTSAALRLGPDRILR